MSFFFFRKSQESSGGASDSPLHACLKWTEEGWMPAGLRVLETQVTAVSSYFTFCALCHCNKLSLFKSGLSKGTFVLCLSKLLHFIEFVM